jgi:fibro-slime domain-containing protein
MKTFLVLLAICLLLGSALGRNNNGGTSKNPTTATTASKSTGTTANPTTGTTASRSTGTTANPTTGTTASRSTGTTANPTTGNPTTSPTTGRTVEKLTLTGILRDFTAAHPDFEHYIGTQTGMVASILGADGNPVFVHGPYITSAASFNMWYNNVPGVNIPFVISIDLDNTQTSDPNVFTYNNQAFFPIDGLGWGNEGNNHNFHFTYAIHTQFTYLPGQVFSFTGDDDIYVFINKNLVIDLGGVHSALSASVNLDTLGLIPDTDYDFDFFFAERHTVASTCRMDTSIRLQENSADTNKIFSCNQTSGYYRTQSEGDWGDVCPAFTSGCYRDAHFPKCFPNGLTVGCVCSSGSKKTDSTACSGFNLHFTNSSTISDFLPQLGYPDILTQDWVDPPSKSQGRPISTSAGNFAGQLTALALSIGFDNCDPTFSTVCKKLQDLFICDQRVDPCDPGVCKRNNNCRKNNGCEARRYKKNGSDVDDGKPKWRNCVPYYGWTIKEIFDASNDAIGGCGACAPFTPPAPQNPQCIPGNAASVIKLNTIYRIGDHPDGAIRPPLYCMRLDNANQVLPGVDRSGLINWSFSATGHNTTLFLKVASGTNGHTCGDVTIKGELFGGLDTGTDWSPEGLWHLEYLIPSGDITTCQLSNGFLEASNPNLAVAGGFLQAMQDIGCGAGGKYCFKSGTKINLRPQVKSDGSYFDIQTNHRGVQGLSIFGWHQINRGTPSNPDWYHTDSEDFLGILCEEPGQKRSEDYEMFGDEKVTKWNQVDSSESGSSAAAKCTRKRWNTNVPQPTNNVNNNNNNPAICPDICDHRKLNECVALINQAFVFGIPLSNVPLFQEVPCSTGKE